MNAVSAGPIATVAARTIKDFSGMLDLLESHTPLRRNVTTEEVADATVFLLSDRAEPSQARSCTWTPERTRRSERGARSHSAAASPRCGSEKRMLRSMAWIVGRRACQSSPGQ